MRPASNQANVQTGSCVVRDGADGTTSCGGV
jgi:hypothetical protein